jgi:hypothetical protein
MTEVWGPAIFAEQARCRMLSLRFINRMVRPKQWQIARTAVHAGAYGNTIN